MGLAKSFCTTPSTEWEPSSQRGGTAAQLSDSPTGPLTPTGGRYRPLGGTLPVRAAGGHFPGGITWVGSTALVYPGPSVCSTGAIFRTT